MAARAYRNTHEPHRMDLHQTFQLICNEVDARPESRRKRKKLPVKRELRLALTGRCNYRCFFCHNEGLSSQPESRRYNTADAARMLSKAIELGYTDITLTGGEPMLRKGELAILLRVLANLKSATPPALTIVSNGSLWDMATVQAVAAYPGEIKIHVSLHAAEPGAYSKITGTRNQYAKVLANIKAMTAIGIRVKLNAVILKDQNNSKPQLEAMLRLAGRRGVYSVKWIELLVTRGNDKWYPYFFSAEAIQGALLSLGCKQQSRFGRGAVYSWGQVPGLRIEVEKCTCKLGCAHCIDLRDRMIGEDLKYYPCFIQTKRGIDLKCGSALVKAFRKGNEIVSGFAMKYGEDSPVLIAQDRYIASREEVFFESPMAYSDCKRALTTVGYVHSKTRSFISRFLQPKDASDSWLNFRQVLKYGWDEHTPNRVQFIGSLHSYRKRQGYLCCKQQFLDNRSPPECSTADEAERIMCAIGFVTYLTHRFEIQDFERDGSCVSLDKSTARVNFKIPFTLITSGEIDRVITALDAHPIGIPFTKWLMDQHRS